MSPPNHDNPYADEPRQPAPAAAPASRDAQRSAARRPESRGAHAETREKPAARGGRAPAAGSGRAPRAAAKVATKVATKAPAKAPAKAARPAGRTAPAEPAAAAAKSRRRGRGRSAYGSEGRVSQLTSMPTSRNAYMETRLWLLEQHGPVCAYCGRQFTASVMTLDHVAPRRGQTAFDRRDNLVLACPGCNAVKRDLAPAAFLLGQKARAANLVKYGSHLSPMLVSLARSLAPAHVHTESMPPAEVVRRLPITWDEDEDDVNPYKD